MTFIAKKSPKNILSYNKLPFVPLALSLAISACSTPTGSPTGTAVDVELGGESRVVQHPQVLVETAAGDIVADSHNSAEQYSIEEIVVTGNVAEKHGPRRRDQPQQEREAPAVSTFRRATMSANAMSTIAKSSSAQHNPGHYYPHPVDPIVHPRTNTERYPEAQYNAVKQVTADPVSTFSIDVDTAAYANARRQITAGQLPPAEAIRVEEFINYFNYSYPQPRSGGAPFSITTEVGPSPWNADRQLMLVGLQGYEVERNELPPANLVFLIDVSGSMNNPQKLGLLKSSMKMLTKQLRPEDTISIAVYAGAAGEVLAPTNGNQRAKIMRAIDSLRSGGSTNGGAGIKLAYSMAQREFKDGGINRVILATDGDFNVGLQSTNALRKLVEKKRETGVSLTVLGFGAGNYNDEFMQELAQKGNGNAAYIDSIFEARKVLVDEIGSTLTTIAKDVKIQVEFNPDVVREYRLIGYETRALKREDFNNDTIDAGEIGAGHSVTALYELTLASASSPSVDKLRYGKNHGNSERTDANIGDRHPANIGDELAHVKLRFKAPQGDTSKLLERVVRSSAIESRLSATSENFRFAAAASAFGQLLSNTSYTGSFGFDDALKLAQQARGSDPFGYRSEFERLLRTAGELAPYEDNNPDSLSMR